MADSTSGDSTQDDTGAFWRTKTLEEMTSDEWESLCDGCARCCIHRLEDEDTGQVHETMVSCRLLDVQTCRCTMYANRNVEVPGCSLLTPAGVRAMSWLPSTCAYKRVAEGNDLPRWHHLRTGSTEGVHEAKVSVRGRVLSELMMGSDDLEDLIVDWDSLRGDAAADD